MEKAELVRKDLMATTGSGKINLIECDLADLKQVKDAVKKVLTDFDRLDVLINNAGAIYPDRVLSNDGYEMTIAVNHLSHFLLTEGLLELIKNTPGSRIINVSSEAHRSGNLDFDDLMWEKRKFSPFKVYSDAKLCNLYFTYELASRLESFGIPVNALHPGVVRSGFGSLFGGVIGFLYNLARPFMIGPVKGAETSVYLASDDEVASVTSKYFKKKKPIASSPLSYDKDKARKLWEISEKLVSVQ